MIHPPSNGNRAGIIFPVPAIPVYRVLFSVPDISSNTPFMEILYIAKIIPPVKKISENGGSPDDNIRINGIITTKNTLP